MWKFPTKPWFLRGCLVLGGWDYFAVQCWLFTHQRLIKGFILHDDLVSCGKSEKRKRCRKHFRIPQPIYVQAIFESRRLSPFIPPLNSWYPRTVIPPKDIPAKSPFFLLRSHCLVTNQPFFGGRLQILLVKFRCVCRGESQCWWLNHR